MSEELGVLFRKAMRTLTSAVCVVTVGHDRRRYGMTVTAVTSVSADPPSLLVCVNRAARLHAPLVEAGRFCLNILHANQSDIAGAFSGRLSGEERFACGGWSADADGFHCLDDAQASIACDVDAAYPHATHLIVVGRVRTVRVRDVVTPLLYQDGRYTVGLGDGVDWVVSIGG